MSELLTLSKIFNENVFKIPDYQRGYSWNKKEAEDYWNDILRLQEGKNHYVGVLSLEKATSEKYNLWKNELWLINTQNYKPYYIVDGQQRLTTSLILISSIVERMTELNLKEINFTEKKDIIKKFLYVDKNNIKSKTYNFSYEENNPSYNFLIDEIFNKKNKDKNYNKMTMYTSNLKEVKEFFNEKLSKFNEKKLGQIYKKLTQFFIFNIYELTSDIDVFVAFESMNNRGKPLSQLELLKNRFIYLSTLFKEDNSIKISLRNDINNAWKDIYYYLGINPNNPLSDDKFLYLNNYNYLFIKSETSNFNKIDYILPTSDFNVLNYFVPEKIERKELNVNDILDYVNNIKNNVKLWSNIFNPSLSNWNEDIITLLKSINYLSNLILKSRFRFRTAHDSNVIPIHYFVIIFFLNNNGNNLKFLKLLKNIEKFLFHYTITYSFRFFSHRDLKGNYDEILNKTFDADKIIEYYKNQLINFSEEKNDFYKLFVKNFHENFNNKPFLKYLLYEYEFSLMKNSNSKIDKMDMNAYSTIEHIYPKRVTDEYWKNIFEDYKEEQKRKLKYSIGNLLLISHDKNEKLGNKSFPEKVSGTNILRGYKFGTYSELEVAEFKDWTAKCIYNRGKKLIEFMNQKWDMKLNNKDIPELLGLEFMIKHKNWLIFCGMRRSWTFGQLINSYYT